MPFGSGTANARAKLSEADIKRAFQMQTAGMGVRAIARELDVAPSTVSRALRGKTWRDLFLSRKEFSDEEFINEASERNEA